MAQKKKNGRPTSYKPQYCAQAYRLSLLGITDVEMARFFQVSEDTIYEWKKQHPKFSEAIKSGKGDADSRVAAKLFHRATGYSHPDVVVMQHQGNVITKEVTKHYPPDTTAAIFWLKNRNPALWRDVHRMEHTGKDGAPIETTAATLADIDAELARRGVALPGCEIPVIVSGK